MTETQINVAGMPEFDALLDHIYEYGTASEGIIDCANAFARALLARYGQPAASAEPVAAVVRERDALREALKDLITWIPSADTYRRLGFDPEAPMRALGEARAALAVQGDN